jgi:hypothetical protein
MRKRDFAPELSQQLMTAPTGKPRVSLNLVPEAGATQRYQGEKTSNAMERYAPGLDIF